MIDAIVIGGGIGGLASAWRLAQAGKKVRLIESSDRLGGVIRSTVEHGCTLEHGPDSLVSVKPGGLELVKALGLEDRLVGVPAAARQSYIVRDHRLLPVPEGLYLLAPGRLLPFARSPLISWPGKLRMLADLVLPRRPAGQPEESLAAFVRRRLGAEALAYIAQPLVSGIYTADPETLSLDATMPVFLDMERSHRSLILAMMARVKQQQAAAAQTATGPRYGLFLSLQGGLQTLVDTLVSRLAGVDVQLGTPARSLRRIEGGWEVDGIATRHVVLALPAHAAAALAPAPLADELAAIPYAGVATVNLAFAKADCPAIPTGAGFVIPARLGMGTVACTFAHQKYPGRCPDDRVLLRAFVGGALHEHLLADSDDALIARTLADLRRCLGKLPEPQFARLHRWPKAMAQYVIGHRARTARIRAATPPGLHLVGNGYEGVGIPDLAAQAATAATACT